MTIKNNNIFYLKKNILFLIYTYNTVSLKTIKKK